MLCRYGGEEFILFVPTTSEIKINHVAEKVRKVIESSSFVYESEKIDITISVGGALYDGNQLSKSIINADDQLYKAKKLGRNNCQFYHA